MVSPEDEISDFDFEKGIRVQSKLDEAMKYLMEFQEQIPDRLRNFEEHYIIIHRDKLDEIEGKLVHLEHKMETFKRKMAVNARNEKYKYQGYHAL